MQGRSKEKKEEKDRKDRKRVSVWDYQPSPPPPTPSHVGLLRRRRPERQCNTSNVRFLFPPGSFCQWARDEPRTQTEKGRKWHQYVRRLARTAHSSAHHRRRAALNCQPLFPQILSKTARALPPTRRSQPRERRASAPNRPAKRRPRRWSPSAPPPGAKRSPTATACSQTVHPCCPSPLIWTPVSSLLQESRHEKEKSEKKEKRDSTGGKEEKKQYPWTEPKIRILLTFPSSFLHFN